MENNSGWFFWRSSCQHYICDRSVKWMESLGPPSREASAWGCGHTRGAGSGVRQSLSCPQRATSTFYWVRDTSPISEGKVWRKGQLLVRASNKTEQGFKFQTLQMNAVTTKPSGCSWWASPSLFLQQTILASFWQNLKTSILFLWWNSCFAANIYST